MNIVETEAGVYSVLLDGASFEVRVFGSQITVNGYSFEISLEDPRQWKRSGAAADAQGKISILAPMPGKVVRILVRVGDAVSAGQPIVVVEAMKMQNELKSPRDGRVTEVRAKENDSVNAGAVLAVIE
jgi:biotin carboxyl carrier protein